MTDGFESIDRVIARTPPEADPRVTCQQGRRGRCRRPMQKRTNEAKTDGAHTTTYARWTCPYGHAHVEAYDQYAFNRGEADIDFLVLL